MILTLILSAVVVYVIVILGMLCAACKHCEPHTYHTEDGECPFNKDNKL